jgi:hypothetical protein
MRLLSQLLYITRQHLWVPSPSDPSDLNDFNLPNKLYVCHAAHQAYKEGEITEDELNAIQEFIQDKLFPSFSYGGFMIKNYGVRFKGLVEEQNSRVKWVNNMIQVLREGNR